MNQTANAAGYRQPAEWSRHESCWLAWPSHGDLWEDALEPVRDAFVDFARAIADVDASTGAPRGERLDVLVPDVENAALAKTRLAGLPATFHDVPFGDIWLRDTAPVFLASGRDVAAVTFGFNGWGRKYVLPHDAEVSASIAKASGLASFNVPWVLEGGSVEVDGEGTCLTTRQCLLNPNRNPSMSKKEIEWGLREALGVDEILWLGDGLFNDHTDGHVDTIARFVAPGVVVCMEARDEGDPNRRVLEEIANGLSEMTDEKGRRLDVVRVPSPGRILDADDRVMPASYVNFYIANTTVVVPTYGTRWDDEAVEKIGALFPGRRTVGIRAKELLEGGGAFHCISQQQPRVG